MKILPALLLSLLLAACTAEAPLAPGTPPAASAADDEAWYRQAAQTGQAVYRIDPERTLITVTVRRGGALARLGHDHVVASRSVDGFIAPDSARADFRFRLDQMTVDEAALRTAAGLDTQPSAPAIEGTRNNMLTRVLDAGRFPIVRMRAQRSAKGAGHVRLEVTLHGVTRSVDTPVRIERSPAAMSASGELVLRQTDFGIAPMSVMGGAMRVEDPMELRFQIVAARLR